MSFVERANGVRKRIPFVYWLLYDAVCVFPMIWATKQAGWWVAPAWVMFALAAFFDVNEAFVKAARRRDG